jgi:UDP-N-acetylglucosamine--N-acetylmuramyl-(pentapeptide) pyrophosphoryl-undecaprenol N-acetylglucosamine transferase
MPGFVNSPRDHNPLVAIACGGTGGHLFPGLAVADALLRRGAAVLLLISPKEVDRQAVGEARGMQVEILPAVGLSEGKRLTFITGFIKSYFCSRRLFAQRSPHAVLAMGGFTSAPPVLAAPAFRTAAFLHEANAIAGRANRWLAPWVKEAFVYFPTAGQRLWPAKISVTGMPVRSSFQPMETESCRMALGLDPRRPVLLIMGGSQGAEGINELMAQAAARLLTQEPGLQFLHLTGSRGLDRVKASYAALACRAQVRPFLTEMEYALGAASVAVSRAGASSLGELAAMRVPSILIPYPAAADNHQYFNALAWQETGAARLAPQATATPESLAAGVLELLRQPRERQTMIQGMTRWHDAQAAEHIADRIWPVVAAGAPVSSRNPSAGPFPAFVKPGRNHCLAAHHA